MEPKDEQGQPEAKEAEKVEMKAPMVAAESAFTRSSLQAKGEEVMISMASIPAANTQAAQPIPQFPFAPKQRIAAPSCTRSGAAQSGAAPLAEQLTSKLLSVSSGRPVKVWLPQDVKPLKLLDNTIPAKKKPAFSEYASDKKKSLDPSMPCKKHMPSWLANLDAVPAAPKPKPQTFTPAPQAPVFKEEPAPR